MSGQHNSSAGPSARQVPFSVKLDKELRERLQERAEAEQRTASQHVRWLIQRDAKREAA